MTLSTKSKLDRARTAKEGGVFNIWYGRSSVGEGPNRVSDQIQFTRCQPDADAGITRGSESRPDTTFCIHFARGCCSKGYDCNFLHRIPEESDESFIHRGIDCFGRERHREDRDDMTGVGSFDRENTTLYVARIGTYDDPEEVMQRHFGPFGKIYSVKVLHTRNIAFVRYISRLNAEFAKEAMNEQSLDCNECLIVRWAIEDPNPRAKVEAIEEAEAKFVQRVLADPARHGQLLSDLQNEHELNAYFKHGDTSAVAAPWLYGQQNAQSTTAGRLPPPPPPPPRKKKAKSSGKAGKQQVVPSLLEGSQTKAAMLKEVKQASLGLVSGYESD